jgi:membrane-bound ClpP family serine protease
MGGNAAKRCVRTVRVGASVLCPVAEMRDMPPSIAVLNAPIVAYGLIVLAAAGLLRIAYVPSAFLAGFTGMSAALLALLAYLATPPPIAGVLLLALGIALLNAEVLFTTFGCAGAAGLAAAFYGSWQLLDTTGAAPPLVRACIASLGTFALLATVLRGWRRRTLPGLD